MRKLIFVGIIVHLFAQAGQGETTAVSSAEGRPVIFTKDPVSEHPSAQIMRGAMGPKSCEALASYLGDLKLKKDVANQRFDYVRERLARSINPVEASRAFMEGRPAVDPETELRPFQKSGWLGAVLQDALNELGHDTPEARMLYLRALSRDRLPTIELARQLHATFSRLFGSEPGSLKNLNFAKQLGLTFPEFKNVAEQITPEFLDRYLQQQLIFSGHHTPSPDFMRMALRPKSEDQFQKLVYRFQEMPLDLTPEAERILEDGYVDSALRGIFVHLGFRTEKEIEEAIETAAQDPGVIEELTGKSVALLIKHFGHSEEAVQKKYGWNKLKDDGYRDLARAVASRLVFTQPQALASKIHGSRAFEGATSPRTEGLILRALKHGVGNGIFYTPLINFMVAHDYSGALAAAGALIPYYYFSLVRPWMKSRRAGVAHWSLGVLRLSDNLTPEEVESLQRKSDALRKNGLFAEPTAAAASTEPPIDSVLVEDILLRQAGKVEEPNAPLAWSGESKTPNIPLR